jgi:tyrosyl-tRNA synthetase
LKLENRLSTVGRSVEEIVTWDELRSLLEAEAKPSAYWGFEPSGKRQA